MASSKSAVAPKKGDLAQLTRVSKGLSPQIKGIDNVAITQAIPALSGDLNTFWSHEFASSGVQWPKVEEELVESQPVQTTCNRTVSPTAGPWQLCFGSGPGATYTFYWPVPWMQQNVDTDPGGVNLTLGMAGQYSDAVLDLFGFFGQLQSGHITASQFDQQNFCLTGIYARSLNDRNLFEQADIPTVNKWIRTLAGSSASSQGQATGQQEAGAFVAGFKSGSPATCGVAPSGGGTGSGGTGTTG